jgi:SAM-dependent methyltransferase
MEIDWSYDAWPSGAPYDWAEAGQGGRPDDQLDFHVDLGCGKLKKGRIGIDRFPAPGVNIVCDFEQLHVTGLPNGQGRDAWYPVPEGHQARVHCVGLPFEESSIDSMISHHCLEHIGPGFVALMDECYRVLKPEAIFRIIVPLFPSTSAVEDPDHKRYFLEGTFEAFCGFPDHIWCDSFAVPYTKARFEQTDFDMTALLPPEKRWTAEDRREMRVTLRPRK